VIVGVDPGTKRVGIAIADLETRFARPVETAETETAVARIAEIVNDSKADTVVVGRPVSLSGEPGRAVQAYEGFVEELRSTLPSEVTIVEYDERLTSVIAENALRSAGVSTKDARGKVDQIAAQVMLQGYLDSRRSET
jgi:putative holliday junction resolvase